MTALAALLLGTVAVARAVRLVTSDAYPPMQNLRVWWVGLQETRDHASRQRNLDRHILHPGEAAYGWAPLLTCPFCFAPYAAAVNLAWALWSGAPWDLTVDLSWAGAWWVVNTWAAVAYLAAMLVVRDEPPAED